MDTSLADFPFEEEEDTEEEEDESLEPTGCYCGQCSNELEMVEEVFLLRVVQPYMVDGKLQHNDVLTHEGEFKYEPSFFCFDCCEEVLEELREMQEDSPPISDPHGILLCDICESDILQGELVGLAQFGEIHWSERAPNGRYSPVFVDMNDEKHICISCLHFMEGERDKPLWPAGVEPVPGFEACEDGLFTRCWRYGNCQCNT